MNFQPIIIIGAPRSGTNMLRDLLCKFKGVETWPCDEINYIWKHGNIFLDTDELSEEMAKPPIIDFVKNEFDKLHKRKKLNFLVEKTCANSLRVPFVNKILPEAKYIFIIRNGLDVVGSALLCWKSKLNLIYALKKVRYIPVSDLPYYTLKHISNRLYKIFYRNNRLSFWGPQFRGIRNSFERHALEEVCALQWQRCINLAEDAFNKMSNDKVVRIKYEDFVRNPKDELKSILEKLNISYNQDELNDFTRHINDKSIGKSSKILNQEQIMKISKLISETMKRYGY